MIGGDNVLDALIGDRLLVCADIALVVLFLLVIVETDLLNDNKTIILTGEYI